VFRSPVSWGGARPARAGPARAAPPEGGPRKRPIPPPSLPEGATGPRDRRARRPGSLQAQFVEDGEQVDGAARVEQVGDVVQQVAQDLPVAGLGQQLGVVLSGVAPRVFGRVVGTVPSGLPLPVTASALTLLRLVLRIRPRRFRLMGGRARLRIRSD